MTLRIGILTVSTRVSAGTMEDRGGPAIAEALSPLDHEVVRRLVVPDDRELITGTLRLWADVDKLDVIFTTGGTGLGPYDLTPEATMDVANRSVPGIVEAIRLAGLQKLPQAMLSRGVAAQRGDSVIINLPGSPTGAREGAQVVLPVLDHALLMIRGGRH